MSSDSPAAADPRDTTPLSTLNVTDASIGIVVSDWNEEITAALLEGTVRRLKECGVCDEDIDIIHVPGAVELGFAARQLAINKEPSAVIMLGCVINDGTPNFRCICDVVARALNHLNLRHDIPFIDGVLMVDSREQALKLAHGDLATEGVTCAETALKMVNMMSGLMTDS